MSKADLVKIKLRSNQSHDTLLNLKHRNQRQMIALRNKSKKQKKTIEKKHQKAEKGILGRCILRSLLIFDVGTSFMADSLHNVYRGAFVSRISLNIIQHLFLFL